MDIYKLLIILFHFLNVIFGIALLVHFKFLFKSFKDNLFQLFYLLVILFECINTFIFFFVVLSSISSSAIFVSKLFLLAALFCFPLIMLTSLTYNFNAYQIQFPYRSYFIATIFSCNTLSILACTYYFILGSFSLWPLYLMIASIFAFLIS